MKIIFIIFVYICLWMQSYLLDDAVCVCVSLQFLVKKRAKHDEKVIVKMFVIEAIFFFF